MSKTEKGVQHRTTKQQLAEAEQRLNRLREQARKEDTRRKVLIGSMVLGQAQKDPHIMDNLLANLDFWLAPGHRDRRLFLDYGLGAIAGLYHSKLTPVNFKAGWFQTYLKPSQKIQTFSLKNAKFMLRA